MFTNELLFKSQCPLIEEFHVKNVIGALERKQWIFGGRVTLSGASQALTYLTLSSGIIERLDHAQILAQKHSAVPTNPTYVDTKTSSGFTLYGDNGATYSIVILGTEPHKPRSQRKWASDYCPFCKSQGFKGVAGGTLKDVAAFSFQWTLSSAGDTIAFNDIKTQNIIGRPRGQLDDSLIHTMADNQYQIIVTKTSAGAVVVPPYPEDVGTNNFTLQGEAGETYDVLILGQILN
jgi:hypothetical protein